MFFFVFFFLLRKDNLSFRPDIVNSLRLRSIRTELISVSDFY